MQSNYIVQGNDYLYCFYYVTGTGILCRKYKDSSWQKGEVVISDVVQTYTVTVFEEIIYLFCQDTNGNVILTTYKDEKWISRIVLENSTGRTNQVKIYPIIKENGLCLIYNVDDENSNHLVLLNSDEKGKWLIPTAIDTYAPVKDEFFQVQQIDTERVILFYLSSFPENTLGYKEITPTSQSPFYPIHMSNIPIVDCSFLCLDNEIHVVYIVKSIFYCQLVYKKKVNNEFTNPTILWEGKKMDNCLLSCESGHLRVYYQLNGILYYCEMDKQGYFTRPYKYKEKLSISPVKSNYLCPSTYENDKALTSQFFSREIYVDRLQPWEIQILPNLYIDYYTEFTNTMPSKKVEETEQIINNTEAEVVIPHEQNMKSYETSVNNELLQEKDKEIKELRELLEANEAKFITFQKQEKDGFDIEGMTNERNQLISKIASLENQKNLLERDKTKLFMDLDEIKRQNHQLNEELRTIKNNISNRNIVNSSSVLENEEVEIINTNKKILDENINNSMELDETLNILENEKEAIIEEVEENEVVESKVVETVETNLVEEVEENVEQAKLPEQPEQSEQPEQPETPDLTVTTEIEDLQELE